MAEGDRLAFVALADGQQSKVIDPTSGFLKFPLVVGKTIMQAEQPGFHISLVFFVCYLLIRFSITSFTRVLFPYNEMLWVSVYSVLDNEKAMPPSSVLHSQDRLVFAL